MAIEPTLSIQPLNTRYPDHLAVDLRKHQKEFDELDIFIALREWGIGIPLSTDPFDGMNSYERNLGIKASELERVGLTEGCHLREIGVDSDIKFFCERLETAYPDQIEGVICAIIQHLTDKIQVWSRLITQEESEEWLKELQEFPTQSRSLSEIKELSNKLIEIYHCADLKIIRSYIQEVLHSPQSSSSSSEAFATVPKVDHILLQFELLQLVENTAIHSTPEMVQVALIQIREECIKGTGDALIKKIYQHTRNLHRQQKKDTSHRRYGCHSFLGMDGFHSTLADKIEIINRTRATLLLPILKEAIENDEIDRLKQHLPLLKQIHFQIHPSMPKTSLESIFFRILWASAHRPPTDPIAFASASLMKLIHLDQEIKISAIKKTMLKIHNIIMK